MTISYVVGIASIAITEVEVIVIRAENEVAGIVVKLRMVYAKDFATRIGIDDVRVGIRDFPLCDDVLVVERIAVREITCLGKGYNRVTKHFEFTTRTASLAVRYTDMHTKTRNINTKGIVILGIAVLGILMTAVPVRTALTAPAVTLTASVQDQSCQGGDFVNVTLTASLNPPQRNVRYTWDFNNDGIFDTAPSTNPTVTHAYPDETNQTAVVKVTKGTRSATDSVSFATLDCR